MGLSLSRIKKHVLQKKKNINTRNTFLLSKNLPFEVREAYKAIRTNLIFSLADEDDKCKIVLITSAIPTEGKTTTSVNLAMSFAQTEARVLIIDCDLRKPRVNIALKADNSVGLTNLLAGLVSINDVIKKHSSGLDYMPSGHLPPNPIELLSSKKMTDLLKTLSQSYDYIFIDTPPLAVVADAAALAKNVTGVLLVSKYKFTTKEDIEKSLSILKFAETKILGVVLNNADSYQNMSYNSKGIISYKRYYGKYSSYKYGYRYGGYYGDNQPQYEDKDTDDKKKTDNEKK